MKGQKAAKTLSLPPPSLALCFSLQKAPIRRVPYVAILLPWSHFLLLFSLSLCLPNNIFFTYTPLIFF